MEGQLNMRDGTNIYYAKDIPENPKAIVVIVHGFAEHFRRYEYVKGKLNLKGYGVYRFDNRGHGKSEGDRGDIKNFMDFVFDADEVVDLARYEDPSLPIFMLGHSMGGFITALYGIEFPNKLKGQILSGAAVRKAPQVEGMKGAFCQFLNIFIPKMRIRNDLSELICTDKDVVENYINDPLVLKDATLRFYMQILIAGTKCIERNIDKYCYPCLIMHGGDDKIVPKESSQYFYDNISSKDKTIKIYDGLYHEIMNEKEKDHVIDDMINWLEQKL
jgi:acylglycerol lipase